MHVDLFIYLNNHAYIHMLEMRANSRSHGTAAARYVSVTQRRFHRVESDRLL